MKARKPRRISLARVCSYGYDRGVWIDVHFVEPKEARKLRDFLDKAIRYLDEKKKEGK